MTYSHHTDKARQPKGNFSTLSPAESPAHTLEVLLLLDIDWKEETELIAAQFGRGPNGSFRSLKNPSDATCVDAHVLADTHTHNHSYRPFAL